MDATCDALGSDARFMNTPKNESLWHRLITSVKNAFAMPPPLVLTDEDRALVEKVAAIVVKRRLTVPAILMLETGRPMNFIASQFLVFIQPFATMLLNPREYERFASILEHREGVEVLIQALSRLDAEGSRSVMKETVER